jgi:hypothetical protein
MDLRHLRHFVVAAEESNFRRAGPRLDINQSIISRHVRDIEEELGTDLFLREPSHGARLTEVGRAFLCDVCDMFDNLDRYHSRAWGQLARVSRDGRQCGKSDMTGRTDMTLVADRSTSSRRRLLQLAGMTGLGLVASGARAVEGPSACRRFPAAPMSVTSRRRLRGKAR